MLFVHMSFGLVINKYSTLFSLNSCLPMFHERPMGILEKDEVSWNQGGGGGKGGSIIY